MRVTVKKTSIKNKSDKMLQDAREEVADRLISAIEYLEEAVWESVQTGSYTRSMHLNKRGDTSGRGESSHRKEKVDPSSATTEMADRLYASLQSIDLLDGATFVNNAPHARFVEVHHAYFDRLRDILK